MAIFPRNLCLTLTYRGPAVHEVLAKSEPHYVITLMLGIGYVEIPPYSERKDCVIGRLFNSNNFTTSAALADVCSLPSAILVIAGFHTVDCWTSLYDDDCSRQSSDGNQLQRGLLWDFMRLRSDDRIDWTLKFRFIGFTCAAFFGFRIFCRRAFPPAL